MSLNHSSDGVTPLSSLGLTPIQNTPVVISSTQSLEAGLPFHPATIQEVPYYPSPSQDPYHSVSEPIYESPAVYRKPAVDASVASSPSTIQGSSQFQDVHQYDYSYKDINYTPKITENKKEWIEKLVARIKNPSAVQGIHLIMANVGTLNNMDTTNQKRAEDLLADLSYYIEKTNNTDVLNLLEEQMADMFNLGQCAQGRVTRLWQLVCLFETVPQK
jgi:hypothetical protein